MTQATGPTTTAPTTAATTAAAPAVSAAATTTAPAAAQTAAQPLNPAQVFANYDQASGTLDAREQSIAAADAALAKFKKEHPDFKPEEDLRTKKISGSVAEMHEQIDREIAEIHKYNEIMRKKYPDLPRDETIADKIKNHFGSQKPTPKSTQDLIDERDKVFAQVQTLLPTQQETAALSQHPTVVSAIRAEQANFTKYDKQSDSELQAAQRTNQVELAKAYSAIPNKSTISPTDMAKLAPLIAKDSVLSSVLSLHAQAKAVAAAAATTPQTNPQTNPQVLPPQPPGQPARPQSATVAAVNPAPQQPQAPVAGQQLPASQQVGQARTDNQIVPVRPGVAQELPSPTDTPQMGRR